MDYFVDIHELPFCCGVRVYGGFDWDNWNDDKHSKKGMAAQIRRELDTTRAGIATVNEELKKMGWYDALITCGFTELFNFINPGSSNRVYVMYYKPKRSRTSQKKGSL